MPSPLRAPIEPPPSPRSAPLRLVPQADIRRLGVGGIVAAGVIVWLLGFVAPAREAKAAAKCAADYAAARTEADSLRVVAGCREFEWR